MNGTIEQIGDLYVLRFERRLSHPVDAVWAALTEPDQLKQWLAAAEIEPFPGGRFQLDFENTADHMPGRVISWDPPTLFEHTFGDDANGVVRWELEPDSDGCVLRMSHTVYSTTHMVNFLSGWHTHIEILVEMLDGGLAEWDWNTFHAHKERYSARVAEEVLQEQVINPTRSTTSTGRQVLRLQRQLPYPVDAVWPAFVEREKLSRWYPFAVVDIEPQVGGRISFDDGEGTVYHGDVRELEPERIFSFTEADDLLHLELLPAEGGSVIVLTHTFDDPSIADQNETGWNECLDDLTRLLAR